MKVRWKGFKRTEEGLQFAHVAALTSGDTGEEAAEQ